MGGGLIPGNVDGAVGDGLVPGDANETAGGGLNLVNEDVTASGKMIRCKSGVCGRRVKKSEVRSEGCTKEQNMTGEERKASKDTRCGRGGLFEGSMQVPECIRIALLIGLVWTCQWNCCGRSF